MRIIEERHNHEMQTTCEKCGSTLAYTLYDVIDYSWTDFEEVREVRDIIECPVCHNHFVAGTRNISCKKIFGN